jgi:hypothetical protein
MNARWWSLCIRESRTISTRVDPMKSLGVVENVSGASAVIQGHAGMMPDSRLLAALTPIWQ